MTISINQLDLADIYSMSAMTAEYTFLLSMERPPEQTRCWSIQVSIYLKALKSHNVCYVTAME